MPQHATPTNVIAVAQLTRDLTASLLGSTANILVLTYQITDQGLLQATLSDLLNRIDNLNALSNQYDSIATSLENTLSPPATETSA